MINQALQFFDGKTGTLSGNNVITSTKIIGQLKDVFKDEKIRSEINQETEVYKVEMHAQEEEGKEGGLFFGTSYIYPGVVGEEYFMTRGHYHAKVDTAEYYWCISGKGLLLLMNESGECKVEQVEQGTLHYIPGKVAHRLVNIGQEMLVVGACWPSDAGHDYETINKCGFGVRVKCVDGRTEIVYEEEKNV